MRPLDTPLYLYMKLLKAFDKRPTALKDFNPDLVKNILIVSSTAIGDTLLSTPALRAVRKRYPGARLIALFNAGNMELFSNSPHIDGIVPYYGGCKRFFETARELRKYSFDLALVFHGNEPQATPLCYLSGAPFIIKLPNASEFNFLLSNRSPLVKWEDLGHGITARLKAAALAKCKDDGDRMELFIEKADAEAAEDFLKKEGVKKDEILIGFQPGASTLSRQWFPDRYIALGKRLLKSTRKARIVLTGSPDEKALCDGIAGGIGEGVIISAGRLPLRQLPPLIKGFKCLVTGDTGPMHIAITVGTPVIALYAVSDPARTGPLYDRVKHRVIKKQRTCDPCVSKKCEYQKCMEAITVDEVFETVKDVLSA